MNIDFRLLAKLLIAVLIFPGCPKASQDDTAENPNDSTIANDVDKNRNTNGTEVPVEDLFGPEEIKKLEKLSLAQSKGLDDATTTIHRVFHFRDKKLAWPNDGTKYVAVDVEFKNYREHFDLDDIDIIDGATGENFGSGPLIFELSPEGVLEVDKRKWYSNPMRMLLVYRVPGSVNSIKLGYWGTNLVDAQTRVGEGELVRDDSRKMAGIEFWEYPVGIHYFKRFRCDELLILSLGTEGAAVVNLESWPPQIEHWNCGHYLRQIEKAPEEGWIVLTRDGVWHHPEQYLGDSPTIEGIKSPDPLNGLCVIDDTIFAFNDRNLYRLENQKLVAVNDVATAKGTEGRFGKEFAHGKLRFGNNHFCLLWDSNLFELVDGKLQKISQTGIRDSHELNSLPREPHDTYLIENRVVYRMNIRGKLVRVMDALENVMWIGDGPGESILFNLGDNRLGFLAGIWYPSEDKYIPIRAGELGGEINSVEAMYYSKKTQHFYFPTQVGIYTVPEKEILHRATEKLKTLDLD